MTIRYFGLITVSFHISHLVSSGRPTISKRRDISLGSGRELGLNIYPIFSIAFWTQFFFLLDPRTEVKKKKKTSIIYVRLNAVFILFFLFFF